MKSIWVTLLLNFSILSATSEYKLSVESRHFYLDETHEIIVCQQKPSQLVLPLSFTEIILSVDSTDYILTESITTSSLLYSRYYLVRKGSDHYKLYFTAFPIISIASSNSIVDEPKVLTQFSYSDSTRFITSYAGVELRGASSQQYPKKTYDVELWVNQTGTVSRNLSFGNLRFDDDWVLDALYNEPLHTRSYLAHKLWLKIHTLHYQENERGAKAGADVMYVELFMNGEYKGIYTLSEQIDEKLLKVNVLTGELYKGYTWHDGVLMFNAPPFNNDHDTWAGYEYKYPNSEIEWDKLYAFTDFVVNSDNSTFKEHIDEKFDLNNAIDYFIFINVLRATDNAGKNAYLACYKEGTPYFYSPWDLDGVIGTIWNGSKANITTDILTNGLFNRLLETNPDNFRNRLSNRWSSLREGPLHKDTLSTSYTNAYNLLSTNFIYSRENLIWNHNFNNTSNLNYMKTWTAARLTFLDQYFAQIITSTSFQSEAELFKMYPTPVNNHLVIELIYPNSTYEILNNQGVCLLKGNLNSGSNYIITSDLHEGFYFLVIGAQKQKFLVVR